MRGERLLLDWRKGLGGRESGNHKEGGDQQEGGGECILVLVHVAWYLLGQRHGAWVGLLASTFDQTK